MIIKEVTATGFGTLSQQRFTFHRGLNIVYGPNETGKSTLQFFIYALLWGLKKKHASTLTAEADHYRPWGRPEPFGGNMNFEVAGREYLVERDFTDRGTVKLYDALTGADLATEFERDRRGELLFAQELFGLSALAFKNITYIGQLQSHCQSELAEELAGKLANLSAAGEEEISLKRGLETLGKAKEKIGTKRPSAKPLGLTLQKLQELSQEEKELQVQLTQLWQEQRQLVQLEAELKAGQKAQQALEGRKRAIEAHLLGQRLDEIQQLIGELEAARRKLKELQGADFSDKIVEQAKDLCRQADWFSQELEGLEENVGQLESEYRRLSDDFNAAEQKRARICAALPSPPPQHYQSLQTKKEALAQRRACLKQERISLQQKLPASLPWPSLIFSLLCGFLGLSWSLFFLPAGLGLVIFVFLLQRRKTLQRKLQAKLETLTLQEGQLDREEAALLAGFAELAELLGAELPASILAWQRQGEKLAELRGSLAGLESQLQQSRQKQKARQEELQQVETQIRSLWQTVNVTCWDQFWHQADLSFQRQELAESQKRKEERLGYLLAGEDPSALLARLEELGEPDEGTVEDLAEIESRLAQLADKLNELAVRRGTIRGRLDLQLKSPAVLAARLRQAEEDFQKLSLKREALEYAEEVLIQCAGELHRQFAPELNRQVSQAFCALTLGKYKQVQVDEDLKLSLRKADGGLVEAERLSGGALDQLYFALRLGLSNLVGKEGVALPFLLDDTFVQYDGARARQGWQCLRELAEEHQIIYFTCHRQQLAYCGAEAKIIDLSEERREAL